MSQSKPQTHMMRDISQKQVTVFMLCAGCESLLYDTSHVVPVFALRWYQMWIILFYNGCIFWCFIERWLRGMKHFCLSLFWSKNSFFNWWMWYSWMEYYWIIPSNNIHESGEEGLNRRCNKPCFIWCVIIELVNGFYDPVNLECQKTFQHWWKESLQWWNF